MRVMERWELMRRRFNDFDKIKDILRKFDLIKGKKKNVRILHATLKPLEKSNYLETTSFKCPRYKGGQNKDPLTKAVTRHLSNS